MLMLGVFWMKQYKEDTMKELGGRIYGKIVDFVYMGKSYRVTFLNVFVPMQTYETL